MPFSVSGVVAHHKTSRHQILLQIVIDKLDVINMRPQDFVQKRDQNHDHIPKCIFAVILFGTVIKLIEIINVRHSFLNFKLLM